MPIEIRELVIKAVVQQDSGAGAAGSGGASSGGNDVKADEDTMSKCLDKITEIMKERHER